MKAPEVVVVDYGMGNLLSVRRSLEYCGASVVVSSDVDMIRRAPRVVLPGVGAFADGMSELAGRGLDGSMCEVATRGNPVIGICLGMQMLMTESEEFGLTAGLDLIAGKVIPIPTTTEDGRPQKIPHIGWNELILSSGRASWNETLLRTIEPGEAVYFLHSFMASPLNQNHKIADCLYGGRSVTAVVQRDNVFGCQFHPEKSGAVGLKVLQRFLEE